MTTNNVINVKLVNGFFLTLLKGFSEDAIELVLMKPPGLLSNSHAISMAIGNKTISTRAEIRTVFADR